MAVAIPADESFCYVTTRGRVTGRPHEIEIWYVEQDGALYLMSGGGRSSDWVKNIEASPAASVRVGDLQFSATGETDPSNINAMEIRQKMASKYQGWKPGRELSGWAQTALIVELSPVPAEAI